MRKIFLIITAVVLAAGAAFWLYPADQKTSVHPPGTTGLPVKTGKNYWPGQFWIEIADQKGWFKEAGLNMELVDTNPDFFQSLEDMVRGKMDFNQFVLFDLINFRHKGFDLAAVMMTDISFGADKIIVRDDIKTFADLKGKKIGLQPRTYTEYMLDTVLKHNGLRLRDVLIKDVKPESVQTFFAGDIDGLVTYEPFASEAVEKGRGRNLFDTSEMPGLISDVLVCQNSFIQDRPGDVQAVVNVWHRTTEFIRENPGEAFGIIAEIYNVTPGEVRAFAQQVRITGLEDNLTAFTYATGFASLHGRARKINNFMMERGITDKRMDTLDFLDARFIRALGMRKTSR